MSEHQLATLTPSSLSVALQAIYDAKDDDACGAALTAAASMLQNAILTGVSGADFHEALNLVPVELMRELQATLDHTANFHRMADAEGVLGLWLLPVGIHTESALPPVLALEPRLTPFVMSSIQAQLGLTSEALGEGSVRGWTYAIPTLYAESVIRNASIDALVKFPVEARAAIRCNDKKVSFELDADDAEPIKGPAVYYMPFVAYHPVPPTEAQESERTMHMMSKWVHESVKARHPGVKVDVFPSARPAPFSFALDEGRLVQLETVLRVSMANITSKFEIAANGLAALVAPYHVKQSDTLMLGVSMISRLTKDKLVGITLPIESEDGAEEVGLVKKVLYELGMDQIQVHNHEPIGTIACQHCGRIQLAMPPAAFAQKGVAVQSETVQ